MGCLNHSLSGIAEIYMRGAMMSAKREALQRWTDHVAGLSSKNKLANVSD